MSKDRNRDTPATDDDEGDWPNAGADVQAASREQHQCPHVDADAGECKRTVYTSDPKDVCNHHALPGKSAW